ncbi:hypothetical protein LXL04_035151 [Taraxacum kok-saghyz]
MEVLIQWQGPAEDEATWEDSGQGGKPKLSGFNADFFFDYWQISVSFLLRLHRGVSLRHNHRPTHNQHTTTPVVTTTPYMSRFHCFLLCPEQ